jgi:hypothetical protein
MPIPMPMPVSIPMPMPIPITMPVSTLHELALSHTQSSFRDTAHR